MLSDRLNKSIKMMKRLDIVENATLDAERKAKNDSDYITIVGDFFSAVKKLQKAVTTLGYTVTEETVQYLEESIETLQGVVSSGVVDAELLSSARQSINRKVNPNLTKEWKAFYQKKISGSLSKLNTLGHLVADVDTISSVSLNIANGSDWTGLSLLEDGVNTRMDLLKSAMDIIDELEENLNLSEEIKDFIVKVTSKNARVSDVNDNIIKWIKKENLEDRFVITFNN